MSGIYDATLSIGGAANIAVTGSYVKVYSAPAGAVQIKLDGGEAYTLLEGQGFRLPDGAPWFRDVQLLNKSGVAQTVALFIGDSRFEDTRVTGTVSVIDGGKARTVSGAAFLGYMGNSSGVATFTVLQIRNPTTTRRIIVKRITMSTSVACTVQLSRSTAALADGPYNLYSKLLAAPAAMSGLLYRDLLAAVPGSSIQSLQLGASAPFVQVLEEPFVIPPGESLCVTFTTFSCTGTATFEGFEEANT